VCVFFKTKVVYEPPSRVGDFRGTEPLELLKEAQAAEAGSATGRFATFTFNDTEQDPLSELKAVSYGNVIDCSSEQAILDISSRQGRHAARVANATIIHYKDALLKSVAISGAMVDLSTVEHKRRQKLTSEVFGERGPVQKKMRFQWSGETSAPGANFEIHNSKTKFKCAVTLKGINVVQGLRELVNFGMIKEPVKDCLRDAQSVGSSNIRVHNGAILKKRKSNRRLLS